MLAEYTKKSNIAIGVGIISGISLYLSTVNTKGNIFDNGNVLAVASEMVCAGAYIYAVWAYAKSKGRSGNWTFAAIFGSALGLIILVCLKDKCPETNTKVNS